MIAVVQYAMSIAPVPTLPTIPSTGLPIVGGLIDSLAGMATGIVYGAGAAILSVVNSLTG